MGTRAVLPVACEPADGAAAGDRVAADADSTRAAEVSKESIGCYSICQGEIVRERA